jgi:F420-dependent methylenetetrahydromethanopterin dehydrogenase
MRVLVAFEDDYRAYREVIAAGIRVLRPRTEVETAALEALEERLERFDPQLVVCSRPNTLAPRQLAAWVEIPVDPIRPTKICVGGRYSESTNPTLDVLLEVIDEVEELIQRLGDPRGC